MTNQDLESCKRDIEIIKSTIEKSKVNLGSIATLFILYGIMMLTDILATLIMSRFFDQSWYPTYWLIKNIVFFGAFVLFVWFYTKNYIHLKKSNHSYTLRLYLLWGIVMFFIPALDHCFYLASKVIFADAIYAGARTIVHAIPDLLILFSFPFALLATGILLEKKSITITASCLFPLLLLLFYVNSSTFPVGLDNGSTALYIYVSDRTIIGQTLLYIGYIIMGMILRPIKRRSHGTA